MPQHFVALLGRHSIDGLALIELTDDDLRDDFFVEYEEERQEILAYIEQLAVRSLLTEESDVELLSDDYAESRNRETAELAAAEESRLLLEEASRLHCSKKMPPGAEEGFPEDADFTFVETSLRPFKDDWANERYEGRRQQLLQGKR